MPPRLRRVLLLRHAKSAWNEPERQDFDRPLAPRGRRAAALMGVYLRDEGLVPDLVLCSGARRARETWAIAAQMLGATPRLEVEDDLYLAAPDHLLKRLRDAPGSARTVMLVGHEGGVDALARELVGRGPAALRRRLSEKFPTAALAVLALRVAHWRDVAEGVATLEHYVAPKDLV